LAWKVAAVKNTERESEKLPLPIIKVVGMSASGKSTLVTRLRENGYDARPVSQEHSNVPDLWRQFAKPQWLIYLDASLELQQTRRPDVSWSPQWHRTEMLRLRHARAHADLLIDTSQMTSTEVADLAILFLTRQRVRSAPTALPPLGATGSARKG
jgi:GTPase SAR1 family protein